MKKKGKKFSGILRARELRKESTEAETILWKYLRGKRFCDRKFRRQHLFKGFILDFYCPKAKLAIELDGLMHAKQKEHDLERQNIIESSGVKVLRFTNKEIFNSLEKVLVVIEKELS